MKLLAWCLVVSISLFVYSSKFFFSTEIKEKLFEKVSEKTEKAEKSEEETEEAL